MLEPMLNSLKYSAFNFFCEALIIGSALSRHPLTALTHIDTFDEF